MADDAQNLIGLMYGAVLLLGVIVLILTIWFSSNIFLRSRHRAPSTSAVQGGANSTRSTAPQDGVVIGMDEAALDSSCPTMIYSEKSCQSLKSGGSDQEAEDVKSCCSICLGDYKDSEVVRLIPDCGHMFHAVCIDQWLRSHATCPICRTSPQNLPTPSPQRSPTPTPVRSIPSVTLQLSSSDHPLFLDMRF